MKLPVGMAERALGDEIANCVGVGVRFLFRQIARAWSSGGSRYRRLKLPHRPESGKILINDVTNWENAFVIGGGRDSNHEVEAH